jgi:hypothetical protein
MYSLYELTLFVTNHAMEPPEKEPRVRPASEDRTLRQAVTISETVPEERVLVNAYAKLVIRTIKRRK